MGCVEVELSALLFLYREGLNQPLSWVDVPWAQKPNRLPVVLSRSEVQAVPRYSAGATLLIGQLFCGSGLPVNECLRLHVHRRYGMHVGQSSSDIQALRFVQQVESVIKESLGLL